jgi:hypothetical protein
MNSPAPENSSDGVSPAIKISVIILTAITIITFAAFIFKITLRMAGQPAEQTLSSAYKTVGDRLRADGLAEQAIEQSKLFLSQRKMDAPIRAQVSQSIGELYAELENCGEALVWFYHAEIADTENNADLASAINHCKKQIK